jgi:hypothetical protein
LLCHIGSDALESDSRTDAHTNKTTAVGTHGRVKEQFKDAYIKSLIGKEISADELDQFLNSQMDSLELPELSIV